MSKGRASSNDVAPEYPFATMKGGVRGKYASRLKDAVVVRLDPEVALAFPTEGAVNDALRKLMRAAKTPLRPKPARLRKRSSD